MSEKRILPVRPAIVMLTDARYATLTEVCLASLALSGTTSADAIIYQKGYNRPIPDKIQAALGRADISVSVRDTLAIDHDFGYMMRPDHPHGSRVPNLKALCIEHASFDHKRILYCDSDLLFMQPVEWATIDPDRAALSAVLDFATGTGLTDAFAMSRAQANGYRGRYFNSGVMYINSAIWRDQNLLEQFLIHHREHEEKCPYLNNCTHNDQCAFNMTVDGHWRELNPHYNAQKICMHTAIWHDAIIRHYTGPKKAVPIHNASCDAREFAILAQSLTLMDSAVPYYDLGIAYWINGLRRRGAARRIRNVLLEEIPEGGLS